MIWGNFLMTFYDFPGKVTKHPLTSQDWGQCLKFGKNSYVYEISKLLALSLSK